MFSGGGEFPVLQNPIPDMAVELGIAAGFCDFNRVGDTICSHGNAYPHAAFHAALPQAGRVAGLWTVEVCRGGVFRAGILHHGRGWCAGFHGLWAAGLDGAEVVRRRLVAIFQFLLRQFRGIEFRYSCFWECLNQ